MGINKNGNWHGRWGIQLCKHAVQSKAWMLRADDRALLAMVLDGGFTFRQIADALGNDRSTVTRRIQRIARLLSRSEYFDCLREQDRFSGDEILIARDHYLYRRGAKRIARQRGISRYAVRKILKGIEWKLRGGEYGYRVSTNYTKGGNHGNAIQD